MGTVDSEGTTCDNVQLYQVQAEYYRIFENGVCNCMPGYYNNPPSLQCALCTSINFRCTSCTSSSSCTQCLWGYYLQTPTVCSSCSSALTFCTNCTMDGLTCYNCQSVSGISLINGRCRCNNGYYYHSGSCQSCSGTEPLCLICDIVSSQFTCLQCQPRYYASSANCLSCNYISSACLNCTGSGVCYECDTANNFELHSNNCRCVSGHYQNATTQTCLACSTLDPLCTACSTVSGVTSCLTCSAGTPSGPRCQNCYTISYGCIDCDASVTICTDCDSALHL